MIVSSTILLVAFAAYCYLPYVIGRALFSECVAWVRPTSQNRLLEFIIASIPGATFNLLAYAVSRTLFTRWVGRIDWVVVASIISPQRSSDAFAAWVARGELAPPIIYLAILLSISVLWSLAAGICFRIFGQDAAGRNWSLTTKIVFVVALVLLGLPMLPYIGERWGSKEWQPGTIVIVITKDGHAIGGCATSFEFSGDTLLGITVADARLIADVVRLKECLTIEAITRPKAHSVHLLSGDIVRIIHVFRPIEITAVASEVFPLCALAGTAEVVGVTQSAGA